MTTPASTPPKAPVQTSPAAGGNAVSTSGDAKAPAPAAQDLVHLTIDGLPVAVAKGTLIIRAAEQVGIQIPRFCDHPLLEPIGACRQCLVEVAMPGRPGPDGKPGPAQTMMGPPGRVKPQASCTMTVAEGMEVKTQLASPIADKAQHGVMELLLINHPLDCPVCDKGGECPLQNQAMSNGRVSTRFTDIKRTYAKPVNISSQVLLDRERCVLCARCTRFSDQIAGDPFIALVERGALQQVGIYETQPFESYFSGNTVQICPVGALTGAAYRFRSRPFDLVSTPSSCEHCASGCSLRVDQRRGVVLRRMAANDPAVNEEWNCDKGRWAFQSATLADRLTMPMVRRASGELEVVGWPEALEAAAAGLKGARAGVLTGGRVTREDAYAYGKFARLVLGTNDIDFRTRPVGADEDRFLAEHVVGVTPQTGGVTYADLESAKAVLLVGFEPEDESPIVFLRLRKANRRHQTQVFTIAPFASRGTTKLGATLLPTAPGVEATVLGDLGGTEAGAAALEALSAAGSAGVILVGERLGSVPGALDAAADLAARLGTRLAWVPRRAGDRGALDSGAMATLLPGGRPVSDPTARLQVAAVWGAGEDELPTATGRDTAAMLRAAASGELEALVVGGVDPADLGPLDEVMPAFTAPFVVSLEVRESAVTAVADVVLPVAPSAETDGSYLSWEGRVRPVRASLDTNALGDHRVLDMLAAELGSFLETRSVAQVTDQLTELGEYAGRGQAGPGAVSAGGVTAGSASARGASATGSSATGSSTAGSARVGAAGEQVVLATWATLLDAGRLQDGEPFLAGTAPVAQARLGEQLAARLEVRTGDTVTVSARAGSVTVPVAVTEGMVDGVLWLPTNSSGCAVRATLGADAGDTVSVVKAAAAPAVSRQTPATPLDDYGTSLPGDDPTFFDEHEQMGPL